MGIVVFRTAAFRILTFGISFFWNYDLGDFELLGFHT
jgi:hypothetical protein